MREYKIYYGPKRVNALDESVDPKAVRTGTVFFGIKIQTLWLNMNNLYKSCGFFLIA